MKSVPRKEDLFLSLAGFAVLDMAKDGAEGDLGAEVAEDNGVKTGRPGDRGPLSASEGEVMAVEVVLAVSVVRVVPIVLVDCRDPADGLSEGIKFR